MPKLYTRQKCYQIAKNHLESLIPNCRCVEDIRYVYQLIYYLEEWNKLRNYEIEIMFRNYNLGKIIVNEPCPYNGIYCAYGRYMIFAICDGCKRGADCISYHGQLLCDDCYDAAKELNNESDEFEEEG